MFISEELEKYIDAHTTPERVLMTRLEQETYQKVIQPRMLSGHTLGIILEMMSHMIRPKRILEIGTYTGYGTIGLAQGLVDDGIMHTIDVNVELEEMVKRHLAEAGLEDKVMTHFGDALKIIPELDEIFDLVFIDAAKEQYLEYYKILLEKVRSGGFILADNAFWAGKVLDPETHQDKETQGVMEFNRYVQEDKRVENTILPVRDGVMVIRKISDL